MTKPLSDNELTALEENLDLFDSRHQNDAATEHKPTPKTQRSIPTKAATAKSQITAKNFEIFDTDCPQTGMTKTSKESKPNPSPETRSPVENTSLKLLAVRGKSACEAASKLSGKGATVVDYSIDKRDPALRNFALALLDRGLEFRLKEQLVHWVLINDNRPATEIEQWKSIELVISQIWFEEEKKKIRELKGIAYIDACTQLAECFDLKDQSRDL